MKPCGRVTEAGFANTGLGISEALKREQRREFLLLERGEKEEERDRYNNWEGEIKPGRR